MDDKSENVELPLARAVVAAFEQRMKGRGQTHSWATGVPAELKLWEAKLYMQAKELIQEHGG